MPRTPKSKGVESLETHSLGLVRQLWRLRRLRSNPSETHSLLRRWHIAARLAKIQRQLKRICRDKRRERIDGILQDAAASPHLSAIYGAIRRLAPKSRHQRIQLRDKQGNLVSPQQETETIAEFFREVYGSQDIQSPPTPRPFTGVQFEPDDLCSSLMSLQQIKALPKRFAPARLWKDTASLIAPLLLPAMNLQQEVLHPRWHEVQVCTLPKVHTVKLPKQVRPISLLHPCNKVMASMLAARVLPKVVAFLHSVPQWAYLPGRSTADALEAVCAHLQAVRSLVQSKSTTLLQRYRGSQPTKLAGGVSISLDIHKAFDSSSHTFLTEAMQQTLFEPGEIDLVLHLHEQADMQFGCSSHISHVYLASGIRQGCSLSPLLWSLAPGLIFKRCTEALQSARLRSDTASLYADDAFASWMFRDPDSFKRAVRAMGLLILTFQEAGLRLSVDKTVIMMSATGTSLQSILMPYRCNINGEPHFKVRVGRLHFKLVQEHTYLGSKLSYHHFELCNLRHRLGIIWGAFWRLYHILRSRTLSLPLKLKIWNLCVFSILRYSLFQVGLPVNGPLILRQAVHRQIRIIAKSPAHIWHESSEHLLHRLSISDPWDTLCQQFHVRTQRHPILVAQPGVTDWCKRETRLLIIRRAGLSAALPFTHGPAMLTPSVADTGDATNADGLSDQRCRSVFSARALTCPHCKQEFSSLDALRVHMSAKHNDSSDRPELLGPAVSQRTTDNPEEHSAASQRRSLQQHSEAASMTIALPTRLQLCDLQTRFAWLHASQGLCICRHCGREFYSWDDLKVHIFTLACPQLSPDSTAASPTITAPENRMALVWQERFQNQRPAAWENIPVSIRAEATDYKHRCPICDQWLIQARGLGHHFAAHHPNAVSALTAARQQARTARKSLVLCSPCRYCKTPCSGHPTKHAAECPVIILARCTAILLFSNSYCASDSVLQDGSVRASHAGGAERGCSRPDSLATGKPLQPLPELPRSELVHRQAGDMGHLGSGTGKQVPATGSEGGIGGTSNSRAGKDATRLANFLKTQRPTSEGSRKPLPSSPKARLPQATAPQVPSKTASCFSRWPLFCSDTKIRFPSSVNPPGWWHSWALHLPSQFSPCFTRSESGGAKPRRTIRVR